jgi:hypothetical protein
MAVCVIIDTSGAIVSQANTAISACPGFVLLDKTEYVNTALAEQIFAVPTSDDLGAAFGWGFTTPMILGLVAWSVALIINIWKEKS